MKLWFRFTFSQHLLLSAHCPAPAPAPVPLPGERQEGVRGARSTCPKSPTLHLLI